ncbi:hypothetical protein HPB47_006061 [Ixodes persulcatus]|uniref:Uncharacterized protein n=1 Tax=Ixodes persulcatus TaxID=34615 RepID=A0AC60PBC8_IXOPE|nr:hypothetical protein HPB47_006061 [Ixodes persulcatus]
MPNVLRRATATDCVAHRFRSFDAWIAGIAAAEPRNILAAEVYKPTFAANAFTQSQRPAKLSPSFSFGDRPPGSIRYLARSGQALRGHSYEDGNLRLLLDERSQDVPALEMWMKRRDKWLSADVQNEVIEIMSHELLRGIIPEVKHSTFFSIIADGTTDVSSSGQFSLCIRRLDEAAS